MMKQIKIDKTFGTKLENVSYYDRKGAYLLIVAQNKAAVVRTPKGYFLLGGGVEAGEDHEACIRREAHEEIGFDVEIVNFFASADQYGYHEKYGHMHPIQAYYGGKLVKKVMEPIELDHELVWIPVDQIESLMYLELQAWALRQYADHMLCQ